MLESYQQHVAECAEAGVVPKPLVAELSTMADSIYRSLNFIETDLYQVAANSVVPEQPLAS